jgi:hypothetical protein
MNKAEYWILETALEGRIPLCCLVYPDLEALFNKPGHGLAHGDLLELLGGLFRNGDIVATSKAGPPFTPALAQIDAELRDRPLVEG